MEQDLIFIIIPNWNLKDDLRECLASLHIGIDSAQEIVVVDNNSTDGSQEMMRVEFPDVTILQQAKNLGYASALNAGIRHAVGHGLYISLASTMTR
jgi:GT2 family glycosyltransferase